MSAEPEPKFQASAPDLPSKSFWLRLQPSKIACARFPATQPWFGLYVETKFNYVPHSSTIAFMLHKTCLLLWTGAPSSSPTGVIYQWKRHTPVWISTVQLGRWAFI